MMEQLHVEENSPHSPCKDLDIKLDDLLDSFPDPATLGTPIHLAPSNASGTSSYITEPSEGAFSPSKVRFKTEPENHPSPPSRSTSSASKRENDEVAGPLRPFKRLREAFSKSPRSKIAVSTNSLLPSPSKRQYAPSPVGGHHAHLASLGTFGSPTRHDARSPSKIPLPTSPITKTLPSPPERFDLDEVLRSFRYTRNHLDRSITALESIHTDLLAEERTSQILREELDKARADKVGKEEAILDAWGEIEELRGALQVAKKEKDEAVQDAAREAEELRSTIKRVRGEKAKAASESQGIVHRLENRLTEANSAVERLKGDLSAMEQASDKSLFELRQRLDLAQQEEAKVREEMDAMRARLDEADFAHRALKEGGARLARDLGDKERRIVELEQVIGLRRGGRV